MFYGIFILRSRICKFAVVKFTKDKITRGDFMKKFKKLLPLMLSLVLAFCLLTGCNYTISGGSGDNSASSTTNNKNEVVYVNTTVEFTYGSSLPANTPLVDVLKAIRPSVLEIYAKISNGTSCGSGVVIGKSSSSSESVYYDVVTCHHVIDGSSEMTAKDVDGTEYKLKLVGGDPESDIAVLRIYKDEQSDAVKNDFSMTVANIRKTVDDSGVNVADYVQVGEDVVAIGNPLGTLGGTVTKGIISTVDREVTVENKKMTLIQTDCAINSGNSGGALFSTNGDLVGIVNAGYSGEVEGLNFAISMQNALPVVKSLEETCKDGDYGYVTGRTSFTAAYLTGFGAVSESELEKYDVVFRGNRGKVYIHHVNSSSTAYNKLKEGDIISKIAYGDGSLTDCSTAKAVVTYLNGLSLEAGKVITFTANDTDVDVDLTQYIYKPYLK